MAEQEAKALAAKLRETKLRHIGVSLERFPYEHCPEQEKLEWEAIAHRVLGYGQKVPDESQAIDFGYTNWRGEEAQRRAIPVGITWGKTEWHPEEGWLLEAIDLDKNAPRQFALADCDFTRKKKGGAADNSEEK